MHKQLDPEEVQKLLANCVGQLTAARDAILAIISASPDKAAILKELASILEQIAKATDSIEWPDSYHAGRANFLKKIQGIQ